MTRPPPTSTLFPTPPLSRFLPRRHAASANAWDDGRPSIFAATRPATRKPTISIVIYDSVYAGGKPYQFQYGILVAIAATDRKSTRLNSSHLVISYAVFCLKK